MNKVKNIFSKYIIKIYLVALVYFLFIDYKYFGITSLIVFSIYSLNKTKLEITFFEESLLKFSPLIFYIRKLYIGIFHEGIWVKTFFDVTTPFADLKSTLIQLNCQNNQISLFGDSFESMTNNCMWGDLRYGPLFHILKVPVENINFVFYPIMFYFLFLFIFIKFRNEVDLNEFEINLIALSPIVNQSLSQLNIDLLIFAIFYIIINKFPENFFLNLTFFLLLALLKYHPIGLIIGYLFIKNKKKENKFYGLIYLFIFISVVFIFSQLDTNFLLNNNTARPSTMYSANGLLTISQYIWIDYFNYFYGFRVVLFLLVFQIVLIFVTVFLNKEFYLKNIKLNDSKNNLFTFSLLGWTLTISIYANYDYRYILFLLVLTLIKRNKIANFIFIGLFLLSPIPMISIEFLANILFIFKAILFIMLTSICFYIFIFNKDNFLDKILKKLNY